MMEKLRMWSTTVLMLLLAGIDAVAATEYTAYSGGYYWGYEIISGGDEESFEGARITGVYTDADGCESAILYGSVIFPSKLGSYKVVAIGGSGEFCFYSESFENVTSLTIPSGVKEIDDLYDAYRITSVALPSTLIKIGCNAFCDCSRLTSVNLPSSLRCIEDGAFDGTGIIELNFPASLSDVDGSNFLGMEALTRITVNGSNPAFSSDSQGFLYNKNKTVLLAVPSRATAVTVAATVNSIDARFGPSVVSFSVASGNSAFKIVQGALYSSDGQTLVGVPRNVAEFDVQSGTKTIKAGAFGACAKLTDVTIPSGVESVAGFSGCIALKSVSLPKSVKTIKGSTFSGCTSLIDLSIPLSVNDLGTHVCKGCASLKRVSLPNTISSVPYRTFLGCAALEEVAIPAGVTSFGDESFQQCVALRALYVPNGMTVSANFGHWFGQASKSSSHNSSLTCLTLPASFSCMGTYWPLANCVSISEVYDLSARTVAHDYCSPYWLFGSYSARGSAKNGLGWYWTGTTFHHSGVTGSGSHWEGVQQQTWTPTYATVYFNANGGEIAESSRSYPIGPMYGGMPPVYREGYFFNGWWTSSSGGTEVHSYDRVTGGKTLYAHWTKAKTVTKVTVTFDANGGSVSPSSQTYTIGSTYGTLPTPTRSGYVFDGWCTEGGDYIYSSDEVSEDVRVLYAQWEKEPSYYSYGGYKWYYNEEDGAIRIYGVLPAPSGNVTIPSSINGRTVKWLGCGPCVLSSSPGIDFSDVTSFDLPSSLEYLDKGDFEMSQWYYNQGSLVTLGEWGIHAPAGSKTTRTLTVPSGVKKLAVNYAACWSLPADGTSPYETLALPEGLTHICSQAFYGQSALTDIHVPESVKFLGVGAFYDVTGPFYFHGSKPCVTGSAGDEGAHNVDCGYFGTVFNSYSVDGAIVYYRSGTFGWTDGEEWAGAIVQSWPTVTVSFNANGGSVSPTSKSYETQLAYGTLPTPTKSGSTFSGWYTSASGGTLVTKDSIVPSAAVTLYAHWDTQSYTITFNANGGSGGTTYSRNYGATLGSLPTPSRTGHTFAGWYTSASGGSQISSSTTVTGNTTYYAHWNVNSYTVTFNANGGSGGTSFSRNYGAILGTLPTASRTGCSFGGWFSSSSGGSQISSSTTVSGNVTYYAHWSVATYTVTFNANGGSCSEASRTREYGASYGTLPTPTRTGYTFTGWFTSANGGSQVLATATATANATVYAHWTANAYAITFNANGGTCATASKSVTYDATYGTLPTPSRAGGTFLGWFTAQSGGTQVTDSSKVAITSAQTLYAHWSIAVYTITFNANGGGCSEASRTREYGASYGTLPTPTRTGYSFAGWFTSASGGSQVLATATATANATVYAHWTTNSYKVSYDSNGGAGTLAQTAMTYDSETELTACVFTRKGYRFCGWATSASGKVVYSNGQSVKNLTAVNNGNVTLYAVWQPAGIKVNYFRQRYPWNGLVDLEIVVTGNSWAEYPANVQAIDGDGNSLTVETIGLGSSKSNVNPVVLTNGTNHVVWDASADLGVGYKCDTVRMRATLVTDDAE